jgi:hypothetical protein
MKKPKYGKIGPAGDEEMAGNVDSVSIPLTEVNDNVRSLPTTIATAQPANLGQELKRTKKLTIASIGAWLFVIAFVFPSFFGFVTKLNTQGTQEQLRQNQQQQPPASTALTSNTPSLSESASVSFTPSVSQTLSITPSLTSLPSVSTIPSYSSIPLLNSIPPERPLESGMARVAILIAGLPRTFRTNWPRYKATLLDSNPKLVFDIFVHTSVTPQDPDRETIIRDMISVYQDLERGVRVLSIVVTDPWDSNSPFPESVFANGCQYTNHYLSVRHMYCDVARRKAEEILGIKYDRAMHLRTDVYVNQPIRLMEDFWDTKTFYIMMGIFYRHFPFLDRDWDFMQFGTPDVMFLWQEEWLYVPCVMDYDLFQECARLEGISKTCVAPDRCVPNLPPQLQGYGMEMWEPGWVDEKHMPMHASIVMRAWQHGITINIESSKRLENWVYIAR